MLIGVDGLLTPGLLHALASMGHGDCIVLVDCNYPATRGRLRLELPGADVVQALQAVLSLLPLDSYVPNPAAVMEVVGDPAAVPESVAAINAVLRRHGAAPAMAIERHAFYAAAETAYAIVQTSERRLYGNVMLTKGVIQPGA